MHYTPFQYHKVQQQFLQQFKLRSEEFYDHNVNNQSLIQYKKLINLIQSNRKQTLKKKQRLTIVKQKQLSSQYDAVISQIKQQQNNQFQQEDEDFQNGFYITENIQTSMKKPYQSQKKQNIALSQAKSITSRIKQSTINIQSRIMGSQTNQNLNLDSIQDRIYTQYNVLESLSHQQSQVQESIICFKRRISDLQQQLSAQNMRWKEIERLFVENNNEMMHVKYTNQEVKSAFTKTKKHFNLDLQGRKQIQQKFSQTNKANFQQSIVNYIYLQKMRQKINQQQNQLIELYEKKEQLDDKQKKYQQIYEKEQQFLKVYETIMKINPNNFIKDRVISILDKSFDQFEERVENKKVFKSLKSTKKLKLKSKNSFNLLNQSLNKEQSLTSIVNSLIDLFKNLKHESVQKGSEFKILISQKDQKQKQLSRILQKLSSVNDFYEQQIQPKSEENRNELNKSIKKSKQIQQKCQLINSITINIEERISFFLSKYLTLVQKVIRSFLKRDKESVNFFQNLLKKTFQVPKLFKILKNKKYPENSALEDGQLHIEDSRNLLINSFQNWQNYIDYIYTLHESKYIQNYLSQTKLLKLFKRIIKTKLLNKQIPTQMIFQKSITDTFEESQQYHLRKIRTLLQILKELCSYIEKVKNGSVKIHCTISYESFQKIQETNQNQEASKNPSQKQLIRSSSNSKSKNSLNQKTLPFITNLPTKTQKNVYRQQQIFHTFSSTQKHLQPNNPSQINFMSKLKKRKQMGSVLNIHDFYEQMREEMQKVHKMSLN